MTVCVRTTGVLARGTDPLHWHPHLPVLQPAEVANLEATASDLRVSAYSCQQLVVRVMFSSGACCSVSEPRHESVPVRYRDSTRSEHDAQQCPQYESNAAGRADVEITAHGLMGLGRDAGEHEAQALCRDHGGD